MTNNSTAGRGPVLGVVAGGLMIVAAVAVRLLARWRTLAAYHGLHSADDGPAIREWLHYYLMMKMLALGIGVAGLAVVIISLVAMRRGE